MGAPSRDPRCGPGDQAVQGLLMAASGSGPGAWTFFAAGQQREQFRRRERGEGAGGVAGPIPRHQVLGAGLTSGGHLHGVFAYRTPRFCTAAGPDDDDVADLGRWTIAAGSRRGPGSRQARRSCER